MRDSLASQLELLPSLGPTAVFQNTRVDGGLFYTLPSSYSLALNSSPVQVVVSLLSWQRVALFVVDFCQPSIVS